jgi:hypothetical protein
MEVKLLKENQLSIEWANPPEAKRGRTATKWVSVANELRLKPNTWAKIGTVKYPSQAGVISKTHQLKVITRRTDDKMFDLYAMYVQPDSKTVA